MHWLTERARQGKNTETRFSVCRFISHLVAQGFNADDPELDKAMFWNILVKALSQCKALKAKQFETFCLCRRLWICVTNFGGALFPLGVRCCL